jgi:manganese/iron transport system ATP-binding protein
MIIIIIIPLSKNMLEVEHLAVSYHDVSAVEDVSFAIASGQMVAVIGPNGAGKSTIFKAILGLVPASNGHVRYRSRALHRQLRTVAYVPQRSQVDWDFPVTVWGAVMMARTRHRNWLGWIKKSGCHCESIVKSALQRVGMWELRDRQIGELSGGQQQRVFLARAIAQEAELLFFDEPFVGVDKKTEAVIFDVFAELKSQSKILLVITHDLGSNLDNYDRLLLMNKELIAEGDRDTVITSQNIKRAYGDSVILMQKEL